MLILNPETVKVNMCNFPVSPDPFLFFIRGGGGGGGGGVTVTMQ